ncbi:amino acid adenylation domain-containing protein [Campylobacter upsaliensis]|uniref:amino acid adenylation domain-containing protein n=4 Tax=Campylobacter upsaliensis TaxID=28080 RepID=UPI0015947C30|nr:amino acid adenylation domain-containing protein [Campylobacter upsaliensis]EAI0665616.1 amino acid adenylation domain-containing protein [Campylobacter upsaliensis]QKF88263.1 AMP-forming adenylation domain superfamily protein, putative D-alanine:D-alanyl carrier protein ligase [Campylobacter upsaliensis RM3940]
MICHIDDFLQKNVKKFPHKTLFKEMGGVSITYKEFDDLSQKVATKLLNTLAKEPIQSPILIILPKSINTLISFFGVAKSGNFYTLLDEKMPLERIEKIIKVLKPKAFITSKSLNLKLDLPTLYTEDFESYERDEEALAKARLRHIDTNLLYVFFTSGSTGLPKGVSISHKSVIDYAFWVSEEFELDENEIIANQAPLYFDNSILDIFPTIKEGGSVHLVPNSLFAFPLKVLEYLENEGVNTIFWVPSVLIYFANTQALEKFKLEKLKKVLFCGEIMPNKQLNYWRTHLPHTLFANLYGPTEITDVCCFYKVDREFKDDELLPIGKACKNTELLVFDENKNFINEAGKKGELFVRGTSLSLGYYNDIEKTKAAFIQNPLHHNYLDLLYKTGDIVAYNEFGELLCYGRLDNQIKFKGHRIELGEIEAVLNSHEKIKNSACIFKDDKLIAFYESEEELDLKGFCKQKLPPYMIASSFVRVEKFALNANGKIDRKILSERA